MFPSNSKTWLGLIIGNSRLHWGLFNQETLIKAWDTNYFSSPPYGLRHLLMEETPKTAMAYHPPISLSPFTPPISVYSPYLFIASVVPAQTELWKNYPEAKLINLNQIPLKDLYPTLGIDRALALLGAGKTWGFPMLVIDGGTALTFTGGDGNSNLIGGAILPGLGLQLASLTQKTGQLPQCELPQQIPQRYSRNTTQAIQSGIIYSIVAGIKEFIEAWCYDYPESKIVITGGDRNLLFNYLKSQYPDIAQGIIVEKNLSLWGIREVVRI